MIRLRDVPGVQGVEDTERLNRVARVSNDHDLTRRVEAVSREAFGLGPFDTDFHYPDFVQDKAWDELTEAEEEQVYAAWDEWHAHFDLGIHPDERTAWAEVGWDVLDKDGNVLICLPHFRKQMICVAKGLRGRSLEEVGTAAWASRLKPSRPSVSAEQKARNEMFLDLGSRRRPRRAG